MQKGWQKYSVVSDDSAKLISEENSSYSSRRLFCTTFFKVSVHNVLKIIKIFLKFSLYYILILYFRVKNYSFKEAINEELSLEHSFVGCWNFGTLHSRSEIPWIFLYVNGRRMESSWNDRVKNSVTLSEGGKDQPTNNKRNEGYLG
jgi:hypothetical protein